MINKKMHALGKERSVIREIFEYGLARKAEIGEENVFDFSLGNPSVPSPDVLRDESIALLSKNDSGYIHGYTSAAGAPDTRRAIADHIMKTHGFAVTEKNIYMTAGAAAALTASLTALVCPGEEVIVFAPYFPEYKVFIERCGAKCIEVACDGDFQPSIEALKNAINERTAAVIINSPNNPTGVILSEKKILEITALLRESEEKYKKPIYIISDEPYRELAYEDRKVPYIPKYYENTLVCYSYSKSLSIPGERIGYVMVSPECKESNEVYHAVSGAGRALGFVCAPSLYQRVISQIQGVVADIAAYDKNRRLLYESLREMGFEAVKPEGAFYLFLKSPVPDANEFAKKAREHEILIVPSDSFGVKGYVRISYCVKTEDIINALPAFRALAEEYGLTR